MQLPHDRQPRQEAGERQTRSSSPSAGRHRRCYYFEADNALQAGPPEAARRALPAQAQRGRSSSRRTSGSKYGDVKEVMRMTKDAGFQNVGLIAEKKSVSARGEMKSPRMRDPMAMSVGGCRRLQERHQHHAARGRRAGAAHHLHGHHAPAPDGLRREGPAQADRRTTRSRPADQLIVSLTPAEQDLPEQAGGHRAAAGDPALRTILKNRRDKTVFFSGDDAVQLRRGHQGRWTSCRNAGATNIGIVLETVPVQ